MTFRSGLFALLASIAAAGFVACADSGSATQGPAQNIDEVQEDCQSCLVDLAECSSTAKTEQQFVECRDLFGTCQADRDLGSDECGTPGSGLACGLCQDRLEGCLEGEDDAVCKAEFASCRQLLMRGATWLCSDEAEAESVAGCEDCLRELASCASSDEASVCQSGFAQCRDVSDLGNECGNPTDAQACELCEAQRGTCLAQSDDVACAAQRAACVAQLSASPESCPDPGTGEGGGSGEGGGTGEGGGGTGEGGGSGEGGGGTTTTGSGGESCTHDACVEGDALGASCGACSAAVCETDSFCCEGFWDEACVELAGTVASCGCATDTCAHDVCETGAALESTCNDCAVQVCGEDAYCCDVEWDTTCTSLAATACGCGV